METLVEIAKRLGIKPDPKMTDDYYIMHVMPALEKEFSKICGRDFGELVQAVYESHKTLKQERSWDKKKAAQQVGFLKTTARPGIRIHNQDGGRVKLGSDDQFVYHSADNGAPTKERFQIDLKMDSPNMEQMWQKLDDFIIKHHASYKVEDLDGRKVHDRTDMLNLYITEEITPEMAKELYGIIGPFLETKHDDFLAGFPVKLNGKNIKGFRYGPEPEPDVDEKQKQQRIDSIKRIAARDLPKNFVDFVPVDRGEEFDLEEYVSLGVLSALVEKTDLLYYLVGKEGKSPFQLGNQFGDPRKQKYSKVIDIANAGQRPVKAPAPVSNLRTSTPTTTGMKKVVLAPPTDRTFNRIVKGKRTLTTALSKASNTVDIFKQYDSDNKLRQMVISNGKYQTVFNYVQEKIHDDDPIFGPSDTEITSFQSMVIQDKNGNTYAKFSKTPKGYVVQKASNVSCSGFGPKPLNTPFSIEDVHNQIRFETKDKTTGKDISLVTMGIVRGGITGFRVMDEKGMYDAVGVRGAYAYPVNSTTIRETELSFIETTPNHPKEIQILPCKDKVGRPAVRVLDEKGKEIYTRIQLGENNFEQIYPNGLHSRVWKEKDGTNMNLIWDPRDPTAGYIKRKEGKIVSENKGTGSLRQRLTELQNTGRIRGQILKRLPGKTSGVVK